MMRRTVVWILMVLVTIPVLAQQEEDRLEIKDHFSKEAVAIVRLLDMYHYRKTSFNDSLSSVILDQYLEVLDFRKQYFYQSDIDLYRKYYRYRLDDLTKKGDVRPAFAIYEVYEKRLNERLDFVLDSLLNFPFDFTLEEELEVDRTEAEWFSTESQLNDQWRKLIKSQILSLILSGKEDEESRDIIRERYERFRKNLMQNRSEDVFELYMNSVATVYDPHTTYFSPVSSERFMQDMTLSLEGIGARLVTENDHTKVYEIIAGGPAFKSDLLHPNDLIVGVGQGEEEDGEIVDVIGWRLDDVVKLIKGPKGTWVRLQILPAETGVNGPSKVITIQRDKVKLEDLQVTSKTYDIRKEGQNYKLGVITVPGFYRDYEAIAKGEKDFNSATRDVKLIIEQLKKDNVDGILMDLRDNGGGSLQEAIELSGLFIKKGPVVQIRNSADKVEIDEDDDPDVTWDGPLTVLINRYSASASEIFAGAMQDYNRAVVVGEQSYGKGTVQTVIDLKRFMPFEKSDLGQLKITFQKFYRVTGSSTQHLGVQPDVTLPTGYDADKSGESSQPNALPWDQIDGTQFQSTNTISGDLISSINKRFDERLNSDPFLQQLVKDAEEMRSSLDNTRLNLNEQVRRKEMEELEKRKAEPTNLTGTVNIEGEPTDVIKIDDTFLREGVIILAEIVASRVG